MGPRGAAFFGRQPHQHNRRRGYSVGDSCFEVEEDGLKTGNGPRLGGYHVGTFHTSNTGQLYISEEDVSRQLLTVTVRVRFHDGILER